MESVSIVGFGRFGKTLYRLLKDDFDIIVFDKNPIDKNLINKRTHIAKSLEEVYPQDKIHTIFYCVPISEFDSVLRAHKPYIMGKHVLVDTLSVKIHPKKIFQQVFKNLKIQTLLTHPMFGPDSSKNGFNGLPIVFDTCMVSNKTGLFWKKYFKQKGLRVVSLSSRDHDKQAASSQGVAHFIGRLLGEYKFGSTDIDTLGACKLREIMEQTCNDTWQLFSDLQTYNPYTPHMRLKIGDAYDKVYGKLLPKRLYPDKIVFGIQGGVGSFNEQALQHYVAEKGIQKYEVRYLYTTERVLSELHKGKIDYGQFAMHNSVGGIVDESVYAMARYKFKIVEEFGIKIQHYLMKRSDVETQKIKTIMAHPQVFRQCKTTMEKKYPHLNLESGKGDLIDTANVAKKLSERKLPKTVAVMGPKILSTLYQLDIIGENLQDNEENYTSFLMVSRW
ncbi:MAG: prephenate dehydrogenase/arogenate dehydrogenase family protein [bacterium]